MSLNHVLHDFLREFHNEKDQIHGLEHIDRLRYTAKKICKNTGTPIELINYALYFHGLNLDQKKELGNFLISYGFEPDKVEYLKYLSTFTDDTKIPTSDIEKVIHDAHIVEGGPYFAIIKSLITGTMRDQNLIETLQIFEYQLQSDKKCYFSYTKRILEHQIENSKMILKSLRENLPV